MAPIKGESVHSERVLICVPKGIPKPLLVEYLNRCNSGLPALKDALDRSDCECLRVFGHKLSGSGGAYGIPVLTDMGALMEQTALQRNLGELQIQVAAIEAYLSRIEILSE
jgi:HPt (histidine-containing phosphotransfer) domain-containing protein